MADAEEKFKTGAEKKQWTIEQLQIVAKSINYDIDWAVVSDMIDKICDVSKTLNEKKE